MKNRKAKEMTKREGFNEFEEAVQSPSGRALQIDSVNPFVKEVGQEFANEIQVERQSDFGPSLLFEHCGKTLAH